MNHNQLQPFLNEILSVATSRCGVEFEEIVTRQRIQREKFLNNLWKDLLVDPAVDTELIFREIDFDTIISLAEEHLDKTGFRKLLFEVADVGLRYGQLEKAKQILQRLLKYDPSEISGEILGSVYQMLGDCALYRSELEEAERLYRQALCTFQSENDLVRIGESLNAIGIVKAEQGLTESAISTFEEAKTISISALDTQLQTQININLANMAHLLGEYAQALDHLEVTRPMIASEDLNLQARVNHNMGIALKSLHRHQESLVHFDRAIGFAEQGDDYYLRALTYLEKSDVLSKMGDFNGSTALVTTAFQAFSEYGDRLGLADAYKVFAGITSHHKNEQMTLAFFQNSLRISKEVGNPMGTGETYFELGQFYSNVQNRDLAEECFHQAIDYFKKIEASKRVDEVQGYLGVSI